MPARVERVVVRGSDGTDLAARLDLPAVPPRAYALFAHCLTGTKEAVAASRIAAELTVAGIGVLSLDVTGLGAGGRELAITSFSSNTEDLRLAADWLRVNERAPQILIGHSLGGAAVLTVAGELSEVRAVVTIAAPSDLGGRTHDLGPRVATLEKALLILHSPRDQIVGIEHAERLFAAARHPKSYVSLDRADHLLTDRIDATYAARVIAAWAGRYLHDESGQAAAPEPRAQVVVAETRQGTFLEHVVTREHQFLADEPVSAGGLGAGPSPYDLLAAALGTCTAMTVRLFADRRGLPLDRVTVEVDHDREHSIDCEACADGHAPFIDRFECRIQLDGEVSPADRARLVTIANRCPVHRTLAASSTIVTTELPGASTSSPSAPEHSTGRRAS